ncbi:FAD-binding oxidoreductase [Vannielia sp. SX4]|uniref:FAD-binding oxidoreductase n=1 Tax=Vannielia sp. SX4 TaxID=3463852 RepID=UPI00405A0563
MDKRGIVAGLAELVGDRHVLVEPADTASYTRDWSGDNLADPLCVVRPASTAEVSAVIRFANAHGLAVVPQGGNTGLVAGTSATGGRDILLNLGQMRAIRSIEPTDMVMQVEAGLTVEEARSAAEEVGRLFPLAFGAQGTAQIGGAIAANAGGLNVLRYGMTRNLVLGLEVVLADGTVVDTLSSLAKDNRGLALHQLFIGTEGTLGVVTAASLRLSPRNTRRQTALLAFEGLPEIVAFACDARAHCSDLLSAFEFMPGAAIDLATEHVEGLRDPLETRHPYYVLLEIAASGPIDLDGLLMGLLEEAMGDGRVLDGVVATSDSQRQELWLLREAMVEAQAAQGRHMRTDFSVPLSRVAQLVKALELVVERELPGWISLAYGHMGDGNVHFNVLPPEGTGQAAFTTAVGKARTRMYEVVRSFDGSLSAEHGIGRERLSALYADRAPEVLRLAEAVKALLDPEGRLNPGCLFPVRRDDEGEHA